MSLLSWLSKFKKTPLEAESESSLSVGCDAPSTSKRPPTDTCSVLQSVDATSQANDCSSAANSGTSYNFIDRFVNALAIFNHTFGVCTIITSAKCSPTDFGPFS